MGDKNLRDWRCGSYDQDGRAVSTTGTKQAAPNALPSGHTNGMKSMPSNAADSGRRNK